MADPTTAPDTAVRRKPRATQRGRQLEPAALADIEALLAGRPRARDSLIEHLHAIQDRFGHLALRHPRALAHVKRLVRGASAAGLDASLADERTLFCDLMTDADAIGRMARMNAGGHPITRPDD